MCFPHLNQSLHTFPGLPWALVQTSSRPQEIARPQSLNCMKEIESGEECGALAAKSLQTEGAHYQSSIKGVMYLEYTRPDGH